MRWKTAVGIGAGVTAGAATLAGVGVGLAGWKMYQRLRAGESMARRVALITGGSRGLGLALAEEFAGQGARVVICARDQRELETARARLAALGAEVLAVTCDVTVQDEVQNLVNEASARFGRVDVLVNNAGVIQVGPLEAQTLADFQEAMDVMFWGTVYPTLAVLPQMKRRGGGHIANITSIGGKVSVPHLLPYSCAKFAAVGFSEGLRAELGRRGIQVTTVVPGLMRTGSHLNAYFKGKNEDEFTWFSLGATLPVAAMSARRAARKIVGAIRRGQAELILTPQAKALALAHGVAPGTTSEVLGLVNRLLPQGDGQGRERRLGRESETRITRSPLTALGRKAARDLNQENAGVAERGAPGANPSVQPA
ncbi:MAG TPA: SDR family NAD(P)-dependent oxidoreductase [Terriglobales bacterium]|nr:SDR family NAD(P)-dependent oxidoreductase [Terriglobales bacterium]